MSFNGIVEPYESKRTGKRLYRIGSTGNSNRVIVNGDELRQIGNIIQAMVQEDSNGNNGK